jgi:hypothetical protein
MFPKDGVSLDLAAGLELTQAAIRSGEPRCFPTPSFSIYVSRLRSTDDPYPGSDSTLFSFNCAGYFYLQCSFWGNVCRRPSDHDIEGTGHYDPAHIAVQKLQVLGP